MLQYANTNNICILVFIRKCVCRRIEKIRPPGPQVHCLLAHRVDHPFYEVERPFASVVVVFRFFLFILCCLLWFREMLISFAFRTSSSNSKKQRKIINIKARDRLKLRKAVCHIVFVFVFVFFVYFIVFKCFLWHSHPKKCSRTGSTNNRRCGKANRVDRRMPTEVQQ